MPTEVFFTAKADGTKQRYLKRLPKNFKKNHTYHVLIAMHGHGSDCNQAFTDRPEFQAARDVAAQYRMIYISPDYRAPHSWMGPSAEADMLQIIEDLRAEYNIGKIFLTGGSMGGTSALIFAVLHPEMIAGVCSQNATANLLEFETSFPEIHEAMQASYGGTKAQLPHEYKLRSPEYWPARVKMPVAIAVGGKDQVVPPDSVLRLAMTLEENYRPVHLIFRLDGGHNTSYDDTMSGLEYVIKEALGGSK